MTIAIAMPTSQLIAVTPPCVASDAGSRKNPEPIMLFATTNVASTGPIFFAFVIVFRAPEREAPARGRRFGTSGLRNHVAGIVRHLRTVLLLEPLREPGVVHAVDEVQRDRADHVPHEEHQHALLDGED